MKHVLLALVLIAGCSDAPLLELKIITPPGADPLTGVDVVRLHVTDPAVDRKFQVIDPAHIDLEVEVAVESAAGVITLEGSASGKLAARGETPPLLLAPAEGTLSIMVARAGATSALTPALKQPVFDPITQLLPGLGILLAGGSDAAGKAVKSAALYNFFSHQLGDLPAMPEARSGAVAAYCGSRCVSIALGGDGTNLAKTVLSYDGAMWATFSDGLDDLARRTGSATAPLDDGTYVVAGGLDSKGAALDTLLLLDPGSSTSVPGLRKLSSRSAAARPSPVAAGTGAFALISGAGKAEVFSRISLSSQVVTLSGTAPHSGAAVSAMSDGSFMLVGGKDAAGKLLADAWRVEPKTLKVTYYKDALSAGRHGHAVRQVGTRLVVLGGSGSAGLAAKLEILDAITLKAVSSADQAIPRQGPRVERLGPGSLLVAGGVDKAGAAVPSLEIFESGEAVK